MVSSLTQTPNVWEEFKPVERYLPSGARVSLREWIARSNISLRGKSYSTDKHQYLEKIIDDTHVYQVFRKGAQVGISTTVLLKSMWIADCLGRKCVYYFQNDKAVEDFSNDYCMPLLESSPYLNSRLRTTNNMGLKQIGPGTLYLRGLGFSKAKGRVKSIDADCIVLDELDEARPESVAFAADRLMASDLQWVIALSQPSLPGFGIDKEFQVTDQHFWHCKCEKCGHWTCLDLTFPECMKPIPSNLERSFPDGATHYRGCMRCGAHLNMANGDWVAKHPMRPRRGYHLSQLFSQIKPQAFPNKATKIMADYDSAKNSQLEMIRFSISILGWPHAGGNAKVTDELLNWCEGEHGFSLSDTDTFMGIDQGDTLTIVIGMLSGNRFHIVWLEETEDWNRLDYLMNQFGVRGAVIDALPNKHSAKQFCSRWPNRAWIQYLQTKELRIGDELFENRVSIPTVNTDRTASLDSMIDRMERGEIILPNRRVLEGHHLAAMEEFRRHCKNLIAKIEETNTGQMRKRYVSGVDNHYGFALNSALIGAYELKIGASGPMVIPVFPGLPKMGRA